MNEVSTSYSAAGVDIAEADNAVDRIKSIVASTSRPEVIGGIGGFGGLFAFNKDKYANPILVSSTDGVGTKSYVASAMGKYDTIGVDLVAMCVDDLVCTGGEPLFLLDYLSVTKLDAAVAAQIVEGVAEGCRIAGCALIGGEMAEHPTPHAAHPTPHAAHPTPHAAPVDGDNSLPSSAHHDTANNPNSGYHFDLAGFAVGVVDEPAMLRSEMVRAGDELVGVASGGVRCNGYSLARQVFFEIAGMDISEPAWKGSDRSLGEELLLPSRIYATAMRSLIAETPVHGLAHITGGGIPGNLPRVLPEGLVGVIDGSSWPRPRIFDEIQRLGSVPPEEMEKVFNLGVGMIAVVAQGEGRRATEHLAGVGHEAWVIGRVEQAD